MFVAKNIDVQKVAESDAVRQGGRYGRGFAVSGGVTEAILHSAQNAVPINPLLIDGLSKKSIRQLKGFTRECPGNFIEVMACEGGCLAGPSVICNPKLATKSLQKLLARENVIAEETAVLT